MKYVVFDFDGTIADTFEVMREEGNKILGRYNITIDAEEARKVGLRKIIFKSKFPIIEIPKCLIELRQNIRARVISNVKTFPGMPEVLKDLSLKYTLGVVSSNAQENINGFLEKNDLIKYFEIIYSDSSLFGKQRILKRLCSKFDLSSAEVLYIGDEDRDIQAAKRLGIKIIAVSWGYNSLERLREEFPDGLVEKVSKLRLEIDRVDTL
jgi:phosphoglycolate phosphatase